MEERFKVKTPEEIEKDLRMKDDIADIFNVHEDYATPDNNHPNLSELEKKIDPNVNSLGRYGKYEKE